MNPSAPMGVARPWQLLMWSAGTPAALEAATDALIASLETATNLGDVAHILAGQPSLPHRRTLVASSREDALGARA